MVLCCVCGFVMCCGVVDCVFVNANVIVIRYLICRSGRPSLGRFASSLFVIVALAIGSTRTVAWRSLASVAHRQVRCLLPARLFVLDMQRVILVLRISSGFVFVVVVCFGFRGITGEVVSLPSTCPFG